MNIKKSEVTKLNFLGLDSLDPVSVFTEDLAPGQGQITIICYGKSWTVYWGGMGDMTIAEFFCDCDEHYIAKKLSSIDSEIYDIDAINRQAGIKGIECWRDDPWNDYGFMEKMYGSDMAEWGYRLPKKPNHEYEYLCRIIKAVQNGLRINVACKAA